MTKVSPSALIALLVLLAVALFSDSVSAQSNGCELKEINGPIVRISDDQIRQIANFDPRLALSAIQLRNTGYDASEFRTIFTSVAYTVDDVERHLVRPLDISYSEDLGKRVSLAYEEDPRVIEYRTIINPNAKGGAELVIRRVGTDGRMAILKLESLSTDTVKEAGYRAVSIAIQ